MSNLKKIAITIGDPAGIGPEITLKSIISKEIVNICSPIIIGDKSVVEELIQSLNLPVNLKNDAIITIEDLPLLTTKSAGGFKIAEFVDVSVIKNKDFKKNKPFALCGRASVAYIKKAVALAMDKHVDAIVTAPICKESLKMADYPWLGHTELLAELTDTKDYAMAFYSKELRLILVTIHESIKKVPELITKDKVLKTIIFAQQACKMMGIEDPKIAVAGLNPHAGESGIFGDEEIKEISPAIQEARTSGISALGPYPADSLFYRAYKGGFDIIVCMYHDQGLIPLKMTAFDKAVNITIGLPIIRTSPDHGTAFDISWKGIANPSSMIEAIKLAVRLKQI